MSPSPFSNEPSSSSSIAPPQPAGFGALPGQFAAAPIADGTPYAPSGRVPSATVLQILLATVVASVAVGVAWHFVARLLDLVLIFPLAAGAIVGGVVALVIKSGKCRNAKLAILVALLSAPLVYGTKLFLNSRYVRPDMVAAFTKSVLPSNAPAAMQTQAQSDVEKFLTPWRTFRIYMEIQAEEGVSIQSTHSSSSASASTFAGKGYWAYLGVSALVLAGCAGAIAAAAAREPFCENCGKWHGKSVVMQANPSSNAPIADAIRARDWPRFVNVEPGVSNNKAVTRVTLSRCENCGGATLQTTSTGKFPKDLKNIQLSPQNGSGLVSALQNPNPPMPTSAI